jgi:hypothetical protein
MCISRIMGRNTPAPTRTQRTLNEWSQVQSRRRDSRQGYQSVRYSENTTLNQEVNNNSAHSDAYSNYAKCYGSVPAPIDTSKKWRITGGNVKGLSPFGGMTSLITVAERLRALQAESVAFSETNAEWHKYELREDM